MNPAFVGSDPATIILVRDRALHSPYGIARHVARVAAWSRLEDALRSIAVDLLGPQALDELPTACAQWVAATTQQAVASVCDDALDRLVLALESRLVDAPPDVARRLDEARIRHDAGYD